jgi:hypothetical protein
MRLVYAKLLLDTDVLVVYVPVLLSTSLAVMVGLIDVLEMQTNQRQHYILAPTAYRSAWSCQPGFLGI